MRIQSVNDPAFRAYGKVVDGIDVQTLIDTMADTPCPDDVVYEPAAPTLEALDVYETIKNTCYGGMPIQIGYCNGTNHKLNALEYHRDSEFNLACTDLIVLVGKQQDIQPGYRYDTAQAEAFLVPSGTLIEFYATTLHYAPVGDHFRCVVVLPRGTNYPLPFTPAPHGESTLLTHVNKWLIAHPEANIPGAHAGLVGENLTA